MIVLGLHFGHDASVSVVRDGVLEACYELERVRGVKHCIGIPAQYLLDILSDSNIDVSDISAIAITTSQGIEFLFDDPTILRFEYNLDPDHRDHLTEWSRSKCQDLRDIANLEHSIHDLFLRKFPEGHPFYSQVIDSFDIEKGVDYLGTFEDYIPLPNSPKDKDLIECLHPTTLDENDARYGFQFPIIVHLAGRVIKGYVYSHHFAHACYAHYGLPERSKIIFSHDGSTPTSDYRSGAFYFGDEEGLKFLSPHMLAVGKLYEVASGIIGFSEDTGPGKLMGLAPYGSPINYDPEVVGNTFTQTGETYISSPDYRSWVNKVCRNIIDAACVGLPDEQISAPLDVKLNPLDTRCTALASTIQLMSEEIITHTISLAVASAKHNALFGDSRPCVALTGGVALNCPANQAVAKYISQVDIFVPPAVHDAGLSVGSAIHLYNLIQTRNKLHPTSSYSFDSLKESAYLGKPQLPDTSLKQYVQSMIQSKFDGTLIIQTNNALEVASTLLSENNFIATFGTRSEVGPRALCSRSLLANPASKETWRLMNQLKRREAWRPFAPVVPLDDAERYFVLNSNILTYAHMLVTTQVRGDNSLDAITHVDNSARVQTLSLQDNPTIYKLLDKMRENTGCSVLLNTSFNGPGEPVIETLERAMSFLLENQGLSCLLVYNNSESLLVQRVAS